MNPRTVAHQAPLFTGFSRQEYWSGLPFPSPGDLPDPGIKPRSPALQILYGLSHLGSPFYLCAQSLSCGWLFSAPWTVAHQAPLSMELSRQEYWSGLPLLLQGIFLNQGLLNLCLASPELAGRFFTTGATWEGQWFGVITLKSTQSSELNNQLMLV